MPVRVLIVEDDPHFSHALESVLAEAGFSVRTAVDGKQALETLNREHESIDVAIIDLNLPEISGFEIIGAITRRPTMMRVLATSAVYQQTFLEVAQHMGAHIAIRKPQNLDELKTWIPAIRSILKAEGEMGLAGGALT